MAHIMEAPWEYEVSPFKITDNVWYVGSKQVGNHLIDTGDGLVLIDTGWPRVLHLLLDSIRAAGFDPKDIKYIIHSHFHIDHIGGSAYMSREYGCRTILGRRDLPLMNERKDLSLCDYFQNMASINFEITDPVSDGDTLTLGNTTFTFLEAPGHTPGTLGIFFNSTADGKPVRCGMHGGIGRNTLESKFIRRYHLDPSVRDDYYNSMLKMRREYVDVALGNHPAQLSVIERHESAPAGVNPYVDPAIWTEFIDHQLERFALMLQNDPIVDPRIEALRKVGNMDQLAGIRLAQLAEGPGRGVTVAEFHNAAGLRFTVSPDRCMDIYDFSYKGVNISFLSRNGMRSPMSYTALKSEFAQQWSGGMLSTCGLDNVGGHCEAGTIYPTHGRISAIPAEQFGYSARWEKDDYILEASGEIHEARLYGSHLTLSRRIRTSLNAKCVRISDIISNLDAKDEPFMLLYHCNFGAPLLAEGCRVLTSEAEHQPLNALSTDPAHMLNPIDGRGEELYLAHAKTKRAAAMLYNPELNLAGYVLFDTEHLPRFLEWKMMKSHDYVLALEPCNTWSLDRNTATEQGKIAILKAYESIETSVEIGVLDGSDEIEAFIARWNMKEASL